MLYSFTYRLPVCDHDMTGVAHLTECQPDHDGYTHFQIAEIDIDVVCKSAGDQLLVPHIMAWIKQKLEGDEDLQAAWDEYAGNAPDEDPNAGNGTYFVKLGRVA